MLRCSFVVENFWAVFCRLQILISPKIDPNDVCLSTNGFYFPVRGLDYKTFLNISSQHLCEPFYEIVIIQNEGKSWYQDFDCFPSVIIPLWHNRRCLPQKLHVYMWLALTLSFHLGHLIWGEGQIPQHINYSIYGDVSDQVSSLFQILELSKLSPLRCPTTSLSQSWPASVSSSVDHISRLFFFG